MIVTPLAIVPVPIHISQGGVLSWMHRLSFLAILKLNVSIQAHFEACKATDICKVTKIISIDITLSCYRCLVLNKHANYFHFVADLGFMIFYMIFLIMNGDLVCK